MNNQTVEEVKIKRRGDNVYDVYFNGEWIASSGNYLRAFAHIMDHIGYIDEKEETNG